MNKTNLLKLAAFLDELEPEQFDMQYLRSSSSGHQILIIFDYLETLVKSCGTVGCSLGWAILVPGLELEEQDFDTENKHDVVWNDYCRRVLEINPPIEELIWDFLFSADWVKVDNSAKGAAQRIRYLVEHGDVEKLPGAVEENGHWEFLPTDEDVDNYAGY